METPGRYWRTIRHLKARQIFALAWFRLYRPRPDPRAAPPLRAALGSWLEPVRPTPAMTAADGFLFLNERHVLDPSQPLGGWDDPRQTKLWRYHLHYFDDLNAERAQNRRDWHTALIAHWVTHNPPGCGTGWEPFPTSLRIVNWIKAAQDGLPLSADALHSIAIQTRWLTCRIEHHLSGNHLLANAKALCFAGAFFEGPEADAWFDFGSRLLQRELAEQILPDGGHYELSPMYHALVLEDLLDLVNITRRFARRLPLPIEAGIAAMRPWLAALTHPDGEIAFFNDAALGVAPSPASLEDYAERLGFAPSAFSEIGLIHLKNSGYLRLASDRAVLLIDAAEIGPPHQPGHAHADTLSFELSLDGRRVLVNGGTSEYGTGQERFRQRGTAAHNTLLIDGLNSSEVWSGFRVGRRAHPRDLHTAQQHDGIVIAAAQDGYRYLSDRPIHRRLWHFSAHGLTIQDAVSGPLRRVEARYHFAPDLRLQANGRHGNVTRNGRLLLRWEVVKGCACVTFDTHHPRFGITLPAQCLTLTCEANRATLRLFFDEAGP